MGQTLEEVVAKIRKQGMFLYTKGASTYISFQDIAPAVVEVDLLGRLIKNYRIPVFETTHDGKELYVELHLKSDSALQQTTEFSSPLFARIYLSNKFLVMENINPNSQAHQAAFADLLIGASLSYNELKTKFRTPSETLPTH